MKENGVRPSYTASHFSKSVQQVEAVVARTDMEPTQTALYWVLWVLVSLPSALDPAERLVGG